MVEFDQGFFDVSQTGRGICMLCLRQSVCSVLATDAVKCGSENDSKSKETSQNANASDGCQGVREA
jgi:hypothetical protein